MAKSVPAYVPGVCNINSAEIARRRRAGIVGLTAFVLVTVLLLVWPISRWVRLALFVPGFVAVIGFLQARNRFCVGFAAAGQQNATEGNETAERITDAQAHVRDKAKARTMNMQAALIAAVATILVLVV